MSENTGTVSYAAAEHDPEFPDMTTLNVNHLFKTWLVKIIVRVQAIEDPHSQFIVRVRILTGSMPMSKHEVLDPRYYVASCLLHADDDRTSDG